MFLPRRIRTPRSLLLLLLLLLGAAGCFTADNPLSINYFAMSVLPASNCGTARSVFAGGSVQVCVEVVMGIDVSGLVELSVSPPPGIQHFSTDPQSFNLSSEASRTVMVTVRVPEGTSPGAYTVSVNAVCCDADSESTTFTVTVLSDPDPPVITIAEPQEAGVVRVRPVPLDAVVSDNGTVWRITHRLNDGASRVALDLGDPSRGETWAAAVEVDVDIWDLVLGANTLDLLAVDAAGNEATASVSFIYEPIGVCADFEIALLPAVLVGVGNPGSAVETKVTVTPIGGWTGTLSFDARLPGPFFIQTFIPREISGVVGPVSSTYRTQLNETLVPGDSYDIIIRAEDGDDPQTACEIDLAVDVVAPGSVEPPIVTIQSPSEGEVFSDPSVDLVGEVTDDGTVIRVRYTVRHPTQPSVPVFETFAGAATDPVVFDEAVTLPEEGNTTLEVLAVDEGGRLGLARVGVTYRPSGVCTPLEPVADTYIRGGSFADTPHGASETLLVKGIADLEFARKAYLAFDLAALPASFSSVALSLTLNRHATRNPREINLFGVIDNDDWDPGVLSEGSLTWNNGPRNDTGSGIAFVGQGATAADGVRLLASSVWDDTDPPGTKYEFDITDYVTWALGNDPSFSTRAPGGDTDGVVTLLLAHSAEIVGDDGPALWSREAPEPCDRPELVVR